MESELDKAIWHLNHEASQRDKARDKVCAEIREIMIVYCEQEAASNLDTPGGLEHMGDVWKLFARWDAELRAIEQHSTVDRGEGWLRNQTKPIDLQEPDWITLKNMYKKACQELAILRLEYAELKAKHEK